MRHRSILALIALAALTLTFFCGGARDSFAQSRDPRVISARAGGVNFVAGDVYFTRAGATVATTLTREDNLRAGDLVKTGTDGRVEVLLNPGSYLRVGEDAEFALLDDSLDNLRVKLARGTAVIEALGGDDAHPLLALDTPHTKLTIIRTGIYHVEVANGATAIAVFKGRAQVGDSAVLVKEGRKVVVAGNGGGMTEVAKFDKKREADALDDWSRARAQQLTMTNELMRRNNGLARALQSMHEPNGYWGRGLGWLNTGGWVRGGTRYGVRGYWVYDNFTGSWSFVPFYGGLQVSCPYGYGYNTVVVMMPPRPQKDNLVPCRGCQSVKLVDYRRVAPSFPAFGDDFSKGGASKMGGFSSPYPGNSAPMPSFDKAPKSDSAPASKGGGSKYPQ